MYPEISLKESRQFAIIRLAYWSLLGDDVFIFYCQIGWINCCSCCRAYCVVVVAISIVFLGFISTRTDTRGTFLDVTLQGLAPDRGLYVLNSSNLPSLGIRQWERLVGQSYTDCALKVLEQWITPVEIPHNVSVWYTSYMK